MPLTDDDKFWLRSQQDELRAALDTRFEQLDQKLGQKFEQIDRKFEQIDRKFEQLNTEIERVETSLLTEFHKWASPLDARLRTHTAAIRALDLEMEALSDKVKNLEQHP